MECDARDLTTSSWRVLVITVSFISICMLFNDAKTTNKAGRSVREVSESFANKLTSKPEALARLEGKHLRSTVQERRFPHTEFSDFPSTAQILTTAPFAAIKDAELAGASAVSTVDSFFEKKYARHTHRWVAGADQHIPKLPPLGQTTQDRWTSDPTIYGHHSALVRDICLPQCARCRRRPASWGCYPCSAACGLPAPGPDSPQRPRLDFKVVPRPVETDAMSRPQEPPPPPYSAAVLRPVAVVNPLIFQPPIAVTRIRSGPAAVQYAGAYPPSPSPTPSDPNTPFGAEIGAASDLPTPPPPAPPRAIEPPPPATHQAREQEEAVGDAAANDPSLPAAAAASAPLRAAVLGLGWPPPAAAASQSPPPLPPPTAYLEALPALLPLPQPDAVRPAPPPTSAAPRSQGPQVFSPAAGGPPGGYADPSSGSASGAPPAQAEPPSESLQASAAVRVVALPARPGIGYVIARPQPVRVLIPRPVVIPADPVLPRLAGLSYFRRPPADPRVFRNFDGRALRVLRVVPEAGNVTIDLDPAPGGGGGPGRGLAARDQAISGLLAAAAAHTYFDSAGAGRAGVRYTEYGEVEAAAGEPDPAPRPAGGRPVLLPSDPFGLLPAGRRPVQAREPPRREGMTAPL